MKSLSSLSTVGGGKRFVFQLCALLLVISFLFVSIGGVRADWEQFQGDPTHTGAAAAAAAIVTPVLLWTTPISGAVYSSPILSNGIIYVGANDHQVHAINASTGASVWNFGTNGAVTSTAAIGNTHIFFGSEDGKLYALDKTTGALDWTYTTDGAIKGSPTIDLQSQIVYFGSDDTQLYALNANNGALVWVFSANSGAIRGCPSLSNGVVYFGCDGEHGYDTNPSMFYAVNATSGQEIWEYQTAIGMGDVDYVPSSSSIANGIIYFGSQNFNNPLKGCFFALNATNGHLVWGNTGLAKWPNSCPAVANGVVYTCTTNGSLYALDVLTGNQLWVDALGSALHSAPLVASNIVYVGSVGGSLFGINTVSGSILWNYSTGSSIESSFAVDNKKLFFSTVDPVVGALGDQSVIATPAPVGGDFGGSSLALVSPSPLASSSPMPQNLPVFNYGWLILVFAIIFIVVALTQVKHKPKRRRRHK